MNKVQQFLNNLVASRQVPQDSHVEMKKQAESIEVQKAFKSALVHLGKTFGSRIVDYSADVAKGMTVREMAMKEGVTVPTIYARINRGHYKMANNAGHGRLIIAKD